MHEPLTKEELQIAIDAIKWDISYNPDTSDLEAKYRIIEKLENDLSLRS